jgi:hypothetical protein
VSDSSVIKEFLVALGFKQDEAALKKFESGINQATKVVVGFAVAVEASAVAVAVGVAKFANNLEQLYFASQRTGAAASSLKAFDRAAQSFGASAGSALSAAEGLAQFFRSNPGGRGWLDAMLGQVGESADGKDPVEIMESLGKLFAANKRRGTEFQNYQIGEQLGIDPKLVQALMSGDFARKLQETQKYMRASGLDAAAAGAHRFEEALRKLTDQLYVFGVRVVDVLQDKFKVSLDTITQWFVREGPRLADETARFIAKFIDDFNLALVWLSEHGPEIGRLITSAFEAFKEVYDFLKPVFIWLRDTFVDLDKATDGWSTKLIALAVVLQGLGVTSIVAGVVNLSSAVLGLGTALLGLEAGGAILAGVLSTVTGIGAIAGASWLLNKALPEKLTDFTGAAVNDAMEWLSKKFHGGGGDNAANAVMGVLSSLGFSKSQSAAIASNMLSESSGIPSAENNAGGVNHYGLYQFDPDLQAKFAKWSGHDIRANYLDPDQQRIEQTMFVAHELRSDPRYARLLKNLEDHRAGGAMNDDFNARAFRNMFEIPGNAGSAEETRRAGRAIRLEQSVQITVHGSNDPRGTADEIKRQLERHNAEMVREFTAAGVS